jgi:hypothetical protein
MRPHGLQTASILLLSAIPKSLKSEWKLSDEAMMWLKALFSILLGSMK